MYHIHGKCKNTLQSQKKAFFDPSLSHTPPPTDACLIPGIVPASNLQFQFQRERDRERERVGERESKREIGEEIILMHFTMNKSAPIPFHY